MPTVMADIEVKVTIMQVTNCKGNAVIQTNLTKNVILLKCGCKNGGYAINKWRGRGSGCW